ncbi:MAG TPA: PBP1A family penicillin-binding protein, partial [Thermoanaerobaculia bacterium]|nr:PBP1A family penicillin-binding protein [Thermoanaerobaculia bacterium]
DSVAQSGDFAAKRGELYIYTRQFTHPTGTYAAEPIRLTFNGAQIASITSLKDGHPIDKAALEPELLTSILSDQLENRQPVTLNQVPQILQDAVIVTEDVRFWHHPGIDPWGMLRAGLRNLRAGGVSEGASTLTQQLVKNYYLTPERTLKRKLVEAFMAVILDAKYSKQEILEAYLNDIYLGRNRSISIVGVGEASHFYFGHPVGEITVPEAALLAGMIRSPNNYSPFSHPDLALQRRNTVLGLMLKYNKIDQATYDKAMNTPLPKQPFKQKTGLGSIPYYVDRVLDEMGRDYGVKDVKGRGLQIFTAIDLNAQDAAAKTLEAGLEALERGNRSLRRRNSPLQGVLIAVDVPSGEIRALVGGRNYDYSQFNRALNSKRQIGSLIKPFVYATAFEPSLSQQNITQATLVSDQRIPPMKQYNNWSPRNYEDSYHGTVTVREALEESMNSASVRIGLASGIPNVVRTAHTLGVQTEIPDNPAMLLGAVGIPPIEMADAYSTIARVGSRLPLRTIRFVEDDHGNQVSAGDVVNPVQVFPARDMYVLTNVMKGVVDRGTAASARSLGFKLIAAGKTGTTNDKRDAWFIGFTPQTLALTWVGFDDNSETGLSGGSGAVPIWTRYMEAETAGQPNVDFPVPQGIAMVQVDETSGGLATPNCPRNVVIDEAFKDGTQPTIPCPLHSPQAPALPPTDQFGTPVALDTTGTVVTDTTATSAAPPPTQEEVPAPPPTTATAPPPATETRERERSRSSSPPPPSTNTSAPQTSTSSTSTTGSSPPPSTTSTNPPR